MYQGKISTIMVGGGEGGGGRPGGGVVRFFASGEGCYLEANGRLRLEG